MSMCCRPRSSVNWLRLEAEDSPRSLNVAIVNRNEVIELLSLYRIDRGGNAIENVNKYTSDCCIDLNVRSVNPLY